MPLRSKILFSVVVAICVTGAAVHALLGGIILPDYERLEEEQGHRELSRVAEAFRDQVAGVGRVCDQWVTERNIHQALQPDGGFDDVLHYRDQVRPEIDFVYLIGPHATLRHFFAFDPDDPVTSVDIADFSHEVWNAHHPYLAQRRGDGVAELRITSRGPAFVAIRQLPLDEGNPQGWLLIGRFLTSKLHRQLIERTLIAFRFWDPTSRELPGRERQALSQLLSGATSVSQPWSTNVRYVYGVLQTFFGGPSLLLRVDVSRDVTIRGRALFRQIHALVISTIIGILLVMFAVIDRMLRHAPTSDGTARLPRDPSTLNGVEPGGGVARNPNQSFGQWVASARSTAMRLGQLLERGALSRLPVLWSVIAEADRSTSSDDKKLPGGTTQHLVEWIRHLQVDWTNMRRESESLLSALDHAELLGVGADLSHPLSLERASLRQVIEDALTRGADVECIHEIDLVRNLEVLPPYDLDRARLTDAVETLVRNSRHAIAKAPPTEHFLRVRLESLTEDWVRIELSDSGGGIPEEGWAELFRPSDDHNREGRGIGLYHAAAKIGELGGSLTARNDGAGMTFTIDLPVGAPSVR